MYLIAGLGNPGKQYEKTRHNVGFMAIDQIAEALSISVNRLGHKAIYGEGFVKGEKVILVKPQTFMNLSGESIRSFADFYRIPAENVIVIYDDMALPVGKIRIRERGSAGGHNGMRSIISHMGTQEFPRIRVGIGEPPHSGVDFVLSGFSKEERVDIDDAVSKMDKIIRDILEHDVPYAMNIFNRQ